jgi:hypothetical protein
MCRENSVLFFNFTAGRIDFAETVNKKSSTVSPSFMDYETLGVQGSRF